MQYGRGPTPISGVSRTLFSKTPMQEELMHEELE